jgi:hypothetical protein
MTVEFFGSLPVEDYDAVERLVFFNACQTRAREAIVRALELFGSPQIVRDEHSVRVALEKRDDAQCLFAVATAGSRRILLGMVVFIRVDQKELLVVHLAVADRYQRRPRAMLALTVSLVEAVRAAGRRLKGVERVRVLYGQDTSTLSRLLPSQEHLRPAPV